ncbi:hypothetical protein [Acanthopleuribacter pedis]|uniref:Uncharacterized protein n=1 Tax=Acanthopleuribacter pedis TaxID=442870 RepID=A0A8J7QIG3_9BACT|nr:hypothetical protein [Acanthopleuribacter pedis]MBO1318893.1 hypothetical protein [Acanthopleuribacter pedis]
MDQLTSFTRSPFLKFFPVAWDFFSGEPPVYSITRSHGLNVRFRLLHSTDPINQERTEENKVLIRYEVMGREYDLYTLGDLLCSTYPFDETGIPNIKGEIAERIARRVMKRFLQRFDQHRGKLGGLFDKSFDPKNCTNFVVANTKRFVLKIGRYPNMILLKKTGQGKWGYQHVTDLDGLFDFRYLGKRHLIILESKTGRIDVQAESLYESLILPLKRLFPDATFSYVVFADRRHLLDMRYPEYRILQEAPVRIHEALTKHGIANFFFEFDESESDFQQMCRHLINAYRNYHHERVSFNGNISITDSQIAIFEPNQRRPYIELERDPVTGLFRVIRSVRSF